MISQAEEYFNYNKDNPEFNPSDYFVQYVGSKNNFTTPLRKEEEVSLPTIDTSLVGVKSPIITTSSTSDLDRIPTVDFKSNYLSGTTSPTVTSNNTNIKSPGKEEIATAKQVVDFFVGKGLSKYQAAGIAGNMQKESSFNTNIVGDFGSSYGLAQWHNSKKAKRWDALKQFASNRGTDQSDLNTQLEYAWKELNSTHKTALRLLKQAKSPTEAAQTFAHYFEGMQTYTPDRAQYAEHFYKQS